MARIAIDAMGGDYAPKAIVEGALWAAQEYGEIGRASCRERV